MVDMGAAAIAARLRELARQSDARGFVAKVVDMSGGAVTARLKTLGALADMCRRLVRVGRAVPAAIEVAAGRTPSAAVKEP